MSIINRLFPAEAGNAYAGHRAALWLLAFFIALKLVMSINSIANTAAVATGADGIPLHSFGPAAAREVLTLFALTSLGQLALALVALAVLVRYRALVPFIYLMLVSEHLARRLIVQSYAVARTEAASIGLYINLGILALLTLGLILSLSSSRGIGDRHLLSGDMK